MKVSLRPDFWSFQLYTSLWKSPSGQIFGPFNYTLLYESLPQARFLVLSTLHFFMKISLRPVFDWICALQVFFIIIIIIIIIIGM